ncbi:MAG: hypothetical protein ABSF38_07195 [Verrucomicrobiota bacterium]|jgi:anti-sigma factor RsiW
MKQDLELKLQAWLDGELPSAEAQEMRLLAATDPEARRLMAELQGIKAALLQHEQAVAMPETREFYWSKIQQQIQRQDRLHPPILVPWSRHWRSWLAPLAAACALAAALILAVRPSPRAVALNQVSITADGYEARSFRDQSSGMNFVFLQETPKAAAGQPQPARTREDGSSFTIDIE